MDAPPHAPSREMKCRPCVVMQQWQGALCPVAPAYKRKGPFAYMCALAAVNKKSVTLVFVLNQTGYNKTLPKPPPPSGPNVG